MAAGENSALVGLGLGELFRLAGLTVMWLMWNPLRPMPPEGDETIPLGSGDGTDT